MRKRLFYLEMVVSIILILGALESSHAAEFFCPSGNVTCLIAAINESNQNGQENTINLEAGTYTLRAIDNNIVGPEGLLEGPNGLPSITGRITIRQSELGRNDRKGPRRSAVSAVPCQQRRQFESIRVGAEIRA